jgi:endonuclease/exonuclease/phosphatase family metal-dependent hydrolase
MLGDWWKVLLTDVTEGPAGNRERMAYLYDSRKVRFDGLAGEIVLPPVRVKSRTTGKPRTYRPAAQLARTPFVCGFHAGWFKFQLCTVHVYYGKGRLDRTRIKEIDLLAKFLAARARDKRTRAENLILLGDFNIFDPKDATFSALTRHGFVVPDAIQQLPSNAAKNKHYDQIAFLGASGMLTAAGRAGVFDYFESVYRDEDEATYAREMGAAYASSKNPRSYYRSRWRTYQMSDHLPMWVELQVDGGEAWLRGVVGR